MAIQLARRQGWRVASAASASNQDFMLSLGAGTAIDYRDPTWPDQIRQWAPDGLRAAIAIHPGTAAESLSLLQRGGGVVTVSRDPRASDPSVPVVMLPRGPDVRDELAQLMAQIATRELHLEIERVYPFEDAPEELAKVQTRHARGKHVLQLAHA